MTERETQRYDRLPATAVDRTIEDRPTRGEVLDFFDDRFGVPPETFEGHSFWEKGAGSVWVVSGDEPDPIDVEALGLRLLRTGGRHWKPTTDGVQRFGASITRNRIELDHDQARRFVRGEDQAIEWDGDWGYLVATTAMAGESTVLGVGLYTHGELASNIPKARRVALDGSD